MDSVTTISLVLVSVLAAFFLYALFVLARVYYDVLTNDDREARLSS